MINNLLLKSVNNDYCSHLFYSQFKNNLLSLINN